ncbi:TolB family protein [Tahibacter amnicola]|uniref:WD40 repeat protein n=1 Tax=Tahibacter amnicola TaxID=2976241 RepID=A0ABY6BLX0_9GAMM|nr:hypothetical protein [Tahibacter amnicola]UXI69385.1 hypothetical protein N4264_06975 [Tahibacter amnicola]
MTVDALGGPERTRGTCDEAWHAGFDWSPDGSIFIAAGGDGRHPARLRALRAEGGFVDFHYQFDPAAHDDAPRFSPDGRTVAFRRGLLPYSDIYLADWQTGQVRRLTDVAARIRGFDWLPDGRGLVFASDHAGITALYSVPLDGGPVTPLGVAPAQAPDLAHDRTAGAPALTYEIPKTRSRMDGVVVGSDTAALREIAPSTGSDSDPALSPEGTRLAFISDRSGSQQLWLYDAAARQSLPLTTRPNSLYFQPQWRTDGAKLLVTHRVAGRGELVEVDLASQAHRTVSPPEVNVRFGAYAPGSGYLVVADTAADSQLLLIEPADGPGAHLLRTNVAAAGIDASSGDIYYARRDSPDILRLSPAAGTDSLVASLDGRRQWRVANGAAWYFESDGADGVNLVRRDFRDGASSVAWTTTAAIDPDNFALSAEARRLVVTRWTQNDTDIGIVRFVRDRPP